MRVFKFIGRHAELLPAVVAIAMILLVSGFKGCGEQKDINRDLDSMGIPTSQINIKKHYTTANGVEVGSNVPVPPEFLRAIDEGLRRQLTCYTVKYPHWQQYAAAKDYRVLLIDPMLTNQDGSPALMIKGIQSAGTTIGSWRFSASDHPYIVVPHQQATNWQHLDYFRNSIDFESEHVREAFNDYDVFLYYANAGDIHPHCN